MMATVMVPITVIFATVTVSCDFLVIFFPFTTLP
jgi:hypothetical protein